MATITTKYSIGDRVFSAGTVMSKGRHPCPDCLGKAKWTAQSPSGNEYEFACPRCADSYLSERDLSLEYPCHVASVMPLTIGSVQTNSAPGAWDHGNRYMCLETGVGSGSIYNENDLFTTQEEAQRVADLRASELNKSHDLVAKAYDKALRLSDYQLESAVLKLARDTKSKTGELMWNIADLFASIESANDKDEILELIEDYKRYHLEGDKKAARRESSHA